jgi:predicted phage-related endonuclease
MSNYFPFGFRYPQGFQYDDANPDPAIEAIKKRINFLNACLDDAFTPSGDSMPGHIFAAAMDLFQKASNMDVDAFWNLAQDQFCAADIGEIAKALYPKVQDTLPRLEFPNTIALFDCRFISVKEWEHVRRYSIGGSEAGTVLGLSHFQSARILYYEKKSPSPEGHDISTQQIFDYGHAIEDYTIDYVADLLGAKRYPEWRMFAHQEYPFITCNPDGILIFPGGHLALFEAKTATRWKMDDWKNGMPDYYEPQPRQYLEVLNDPRLSEGYIGCCFGGLPCDMKIHKYARDFQAGASQIQAVVNYWYSYIVPGIPPAFSGDPELDMEAAYKYQSRTGSAGTDTLSSGCIDQFEEYFTLRSQLETIKAEIKTADSIEKTLLAEIRPNAADGLTTCSIPGGMTYKIKVAPYEREAVDVVALPVNLRTWLMDRSQQMKDNDLRYSIPKISKAVKKVKTPRKKSKTA